MFFLEKFLLTFAENFDSICLLSLFSFAGLAGFELRQRAHLFGCVDSILNCNFIASVYKGQHASNRAIPGICCVIFARCTSSTSRSAALQMTGIATVEVEESRNRRFLSFQGI